MPFSQDRRLQNVVAIADRRVESLDVAAFVEDPDAVTGGVELLELAAGDDDRGSLVGQATDEPVEFGLGADVEAAARLVEQQHAAAVEQPFRQHDLLLIAARQRSSRALQIRVFGRQAAKYRLGAALFGPVAEQAPPPQRRQDGVAIDRGVEHQAFGLAVLRHQADAAGDRVGGSARPKPLAAERDFADERRFAEQRLEKGGAAGTVEAGQADNLAPAHLEVADVHSIGAGKPLDVERDGAGDAAPLAALDQRAILADDRFDQGFLGGALDVKGGDAPAAAQDRDAVADLPNLVEPMADVENGDALADELADDAEDVLQLVLVERRRRLVHDDDLGVHGQRARDRRKLLVGDGQRLESRVDWKFGADPLQRLFGATPARAPVNDEETARRMAEEQVLLDGQLRHQVELLVDHRNPRHRPLVRRTHADRGAVEQDLAARRAMRAGDDLQQGRLAGAVGAEQAMDLARPDGQRRLLERHDVRRERLADAADSQNVSAHCDAPSNSGPWLRR